MLTVASIATILGAVFVCYAFLLGSNRKESVHHIVVIDCKSTVSRIHVYSRGIQSTLSSHKSHPGLAAYANNPEGASESLMRLLEYAKEKIPKGSWKETEVRLIATTGMTSIKLPVQEKILKVARRVLKFSGFMFRDEWASVISGSDKDVNAWVVANFGQDSLGGDSTRIVKLIQAFLHMDY